MSVPAGKQIRFHYIDGFRAIASVMIVLHHSVSSNIAKFLIRHGMPYLADFFWNWTGSGVNLFFTISGLVLLRPYLRNERVFSTMTYFKKRFIRIYPTYFVALIFGAAVIWFLNNYPTWYNEKGIHVYFSVKETLREAYMLNLDGVYYNLAWWSVQVEALFYILVPLLIFIFPDKSKLTNRGLIILISLSLLGNLGLQFFFDSYFPSIYSFDKIVLNMGRIIDYFICFLMGMLLAARDYNKQQAYVLMIVGAILFFLHSYYLPIMHSGYGLFYGGVLILVSYSEQVKKFLSNPLFLWVGERSYSLFLVHLSVFYLCDNLAAYFTPERGLVYALLTRGLGIPLAFLASMILFQLVEKRFARGLVTDKMIWPWQFSKIRKD
jgi:peptidoglycan/LPS O-acetylase OafA/YrhL